MDAFRPPAKFSPPSEENIAQSWKEWKQQFELYLVAAEKTKAAGETQVAMLFCSMGPQWIKVFNKFKYNEAGDEKKLDEVIKKFDDFFEPKKLIKSYITRFQRRIQTENETVPEYISAVREMAAQCEFGTLEESQVCIQISNGVRDQKLKEKLWEDDLTLDQLIKRCNAYEQAQKVKKITGAEPSVKKVNAVTTRRGRFYSRGTGRGKYKAPEQDQKSRRYAAPEASSQYAGQRGRPYTGRRGSQRGISRGGQTRQKPNCGNCGLSHGYRQCPAYNRSCGTCQRVGHFSRCCRSAKAVHYMSNYEDQDEENDQYEDYQGAAGVDQPLYEELNDDIECLKIYTSYIVNKNVNSESKEMWMVNLKVANTDECISLKIDTGAECSVISQNTYESLSRKPVLKKSNVIICGIVGEPVHTIGSVMLPVSSNGIDYLMKCEVVGGKNVPNILSDVDSVRLNLVKRVNNVNYKKSQESAREIYNKYLDVFQGVGKIPGQYSLVCDQNVKPVAHPPRPIPAALREPARAKLDQLEKMEIIKKVPVGEPTAWCSALHVVHKKSSGPEKDVRITIDPRDLNKALLREYHPMSTIEDVTTRTNNSKYFTVLDANMGYFQIELTKESQHLTTFNTPFGRYQYLRLPMGVSSAPEIYQRAMSELFCDLEGVEIIMDDILIHAPTIELHNQRLEQVLQRCRDRNLKLNPKKTKLCAPEVEYVGHVLTQDGVKVSQEKVKAVVEMPEPKSVENIQTLLGMVTYTCKFLPNLSAVTEPLRQIIKDSSTPGFKFYFDEAHREAFKKLKQMMTSTEVLKFYSLEEPVTVSCDASQSGLGAVLIQGGRPVAYASKALTTAEYAYAQIEKELTAIVFAFKKFHSYLFGRDDITVETDHLPLVRILDKPLHQIPLRLQKMRMALQQYSFRVVGKSGKDIPVADALSRAYLPDTYPDLFKQMNYFKVYATEVRGISAFSPRKQRELLEETSNDPELQKLAKVVKEGWPDHRNKLSPEVRSYYDSKDEISVIDGVVFKGDRVIIPEAMKKDMLTIIHESHLGIVRCKQLARDIIYWPGMNAQIEETVNKCHICQSNRNRQTKEPMILSEIPTGPWKVIAADLLNCVNSMFLVVVDYQTEFIEVEELKENTYSDTVIERLAKIFSVHGIPEKLITDNGPQFSSHSFRKFARHWQFEHITTSPHFHQANGMVERANQTVRHIFEKAEGNRKDAYLSLLNLRNTPRKAEAGSPSQRLFGRRTATKLPTSEKLLKPKLIEQEQIFKARKKNRETAKRYYDRGAKGLEELRPGDTIRVRTGKEWQPAKLITKSPQPRSYEIQTEAGNVWRRNRHDILKTKEDHIYHPKPQDYYDSPPEIQDGPKPRLMSPPSPKAQQVSKPIPMNPNSPVRDNIGHNGNDSYITRTGRAVSRPKKFDDYVMDKK